MVDNVMKELIKRAYESYRQLGVCSPLDKIFNCPKCGRKYFEYKSEEGFDCLWADCDFRMKAPTLRELNEFFMHEAQRNKNEQINEFFQEIMKEEDASWNWEEVFIFT